MIHSSTLVGSVLRLAAAAVLMASSATGAFAAATYTWDQSTSTDYQVAANWTPDRNAPAVDDILTIDGGTVANAHLSNLPATQTIGQLLLTNGAQASLDATAVSVITINGDAGDDLSVPAGCTLQIRGGFAVTLSLVSGAKGNVGGNVLITNTGASIPHRIFGVNDGTPGITFQSGSTFQFAPASTGAGNPFGTANANSIRFTAGSTAYQGGTTTGPSTGTGSAIQAGTLPNSVCIFDSGSTFYNWTSVSSFSGRTYGNYVMDNRGAASSPTGTSTCTILNNLTVKGTAASAYNWNLSANPSLVIGGDFIVETGGRFGDTAAYAATSRIDVAGNISVPDGTNFSFSTDPDRVWRLNGTALQTVTVPAADSFPSLQVDNVAGVTLATNVTVTGILDLTNGEIATGANTLTAADGALAIVRTNGFVAGNLARNLNAATLGARLFPVGTAGEYSPVTFDVTAAGASAGLTVSATATDHPNVGVATACLDRYWTLSGPINGYTASITFNYLDTDVTGSLVEGTMLAGRNISGPNWQTFTPSIDTGLNTATVSGVTALSDWTFGVDAVSLPVEMSLFSVN